MDRRPNLRDRHRMILEHGVRGGSDDDEPETPRFEIVHDPDGDPEREWLLTRDGEDVARFADAGAAGQRIMDELGTPGTGEEFFGILTVEGVDTGEGDDRYLEPGQGEVRPTPLSLFMQTQIPETGGHAGAVLAGRIDDVQRMSDGRRMFMHGYWNADENGAQAAELCKNGSLRFVSADLAPPITRSRQVLAVDDDGWPSRTLTRFGPYTIGGATMVGHPAIPLAVIWAAGADVPDEATQQLPEVIPSDYVPDGYDPDAPRGGLLDEILLLASASGSTALPLSDKNRPWDAGAATSRVKNWATGDGDKIDFGKYGQAFFHKEGAGDAQGDYSLPFADVINGTLTAVWGGVTAAAGAVKGARQPGSGARFNDAKGRIASYYRKAAKQYDDDGIKVPWAAEPEPAPVVSETFNLIASGQLRPPRAWFDDPELEDVTPIVTTDDGRLYGHILPWDQRHTGFTDRRVFAPHSRRGYSYFLTGAVLCDDGTEVATGRVTMGGMHADVDDPDADRALRHYDDVASAIGDVAVGEDRFGVWVAGAVRPGVTDEQVYAFRASSPSGDWRLLDGGLELIIVHAVNAPGFPVSRVASAAGECPECPEQVTALVAGLARQPNQGRTHGYQPGGPGGGCVVCGAPASAHPSSGTGDVGGTSAMVEGLRGEVAELRGEVRDLTGALVPLLPLAASTVAEGLTLDVDPPRELSPLERLAAGDGRLPLASTNGPGPGIPG